MQVFSGSVLAQGCSAESPQHPRGMNSRLVLRASLVPGAGHPRCFPCTPGCRAASFCCAPVVSVVGAGIKVHVLRSEIPDSR